MRKTGMPSRNDLVVCKIVKIFPNSALAEMLEYKKNGMIHVSEIALKWVRDIRSFLKLNQYVVCRIMKVDGDNVYLSIKRVRKEETDSKLNEFKRDKKAEKLLEIMAKDLGKDVETAYKDIGYSLGEEFGSLNKAFEIAVKNPDLFRSRGLDKEWTEKIIETAKKSFSIKTYEVKANVKLMCYSSNGVEIIKQALAKAKEKGVNVKYISAPIYSISASGKNFKQVKAIVNKAIAEIESVIKKNKGKCEIKFLED